MQSGVYKTVKKIRLSLEKKREKIQICYSISRKQIWTMNARASSRASLQFWKRCFPTNKSYRAVRLNFSSQILVVFLRISASGIIRKSWRAYGLRSLLIKRPDESRLILTSWILWSLPSSRSRVSRKTEQANGDQKKSESTLLIS